MLLIKEEAVFIHDDLLSILNMLRIYYLGLIHIAQLFIHFLGLLFRREFRLGLLSC